MTIFPYLQAILAVLLIAGVLVQTSEQGANGAFGADNWSAAYHARRGFEKFLFNAAILIALAFVVVSFVMVIQNA